MIKFRIKCKFCNQVFLPSCASQIFCCADHRCKFDKWKRYKKEKIYRLDEEELKTWRFVNKK